METAPASIRINGFDFDLVKLLDSDLVRHLTSDILGGVVEGAESEETACQIAAELIKGKTIAQGFGLTSEQLDAVTGIAAQQYLAGRYEEAIKYYGFVAAMNHFNAGAFKGMAMSQKQLGIHDEALRNFGISLLINPEDLEAVLMTAECLSQVGKDEEALEIARELVSLCEKRKDKLPLVLERANGLRKFLAERVRKD